MRSCRGVVYQGQSLVRDRPILFSGSMVCGILDGRKTKTRRLLNPQPFIDPNGNFCCADKAGKVWNWGQHLDGRPCTRNFVEEMGYQVGQRLWVRETVACGACAPRTPSHWSEAFWRREQGSPANPNGLWYRADGLSPDKPITERGRWVPSIHMPRWASRITLEVTDVRVERLQDITNEEAIAEGLKQVAHAPAAARAMNCDWGVAGDFRYGSPISAFAALWDSLNAVRGYAWDFNPWVAVISFKRVAP